MTAADFDEDAELQLAIWQQFVRNCTQEEQEAFDSQEGSNISLLIGGTQSTGEKSFFEEFE